MVVVAVFVFVAVVIVGVLVALGTKKHVLLFQHGKNRS